jgi:hypothetical protein
MNRSSFCLLVVVFVILPMQSCEETPADVPLDFHNPMIKPMVTYTYPPMNSIGPYPAAEMRNPNRIELRFNKIMETETLKKAITVSSSRFATDYNRTSIGADGERYYVYPMDSAYQYLNFDAARLYEQFTLRVATTARDINGNTLDREFRATFIPEPYFRVRSISPEDGILHYQSDGVTMVLNSKIREEVFSKFTWEPQVAGRWRFPFDYDSSYVKFDFATQLLPDSITLTVSGDLPDIFGNRLGKSFRKTFMRAPLDMYPQWAQGLSKPIIFRCNQPIDSTTIYSSFHITPEVPGSLSLGSDRDRLIFQQANDLVQLTSYEITIDTSIRSIFGATIESPVKFTFNAGAFTIRDSGPRQGAVNVARDSRITCRSNDRLDTATFRDAFRISPEVHGSFDAWSEEYLTFVPDDSLAPLTVYTITISSALKTRGGTNLMLPAVVSFMTGK